MGTVGREEGRGRIERGRERGNRRRGKQGKGTAEGRKKEKGDIKKEGRRTDMTGGGRVKRKDKE